MESSYVNHCVSWHFEHTSAVIGKINIKSVPYQKASGFPVLNTLLHPGKCLERHPFSHHIFPSFNLARPSLLIAGHVIIRGFRWPSELSDLSIIRGLISLGRTLHGGSSGTIVVEVCQFRINQVWFLGDLIKKIRI